MDYFVYRSEEEGALGPYDEETLRQALADTAFAPGDLGWYEGRADWTELGRLPAFAPSPAPDAAPARKKGTPPGPPQRFRVSSPSLSAGERLAPAPPAKSRSFLKRHARVVEFAGSLLFLLLVLQVWWHVMRPKPPGPDYKRGFAAALAWEGGADAPAKPETEAEEGASRLIPAGLGPESRTEWLRGFRDGTR